jgi:hypothetical protein
VLTSSQLIVRGLTPAQAFRPIAAMALVYFRDASNMEFDHGLAIQVCRSPSGTGGRR